VPREQRVNLVKTAGVATPLGQLTSGVSKSMRAPTVTPLQSDSSVLLEAVGLAAKGAADILQTHGEKNAKREAIKQRSLGNRAGNSKAYVLLKEAEKLAPAQRKGFLASGFKGIVDQLSADNDNVHADYFNGFAAAMGNRLDTYNATNEKKLFDEFTLDNTDTIIELIQADFEQGSTPLALLDTIKNSQLDLGNAASGQLYIDTVGAMVKNLAEQDPSYDWQGAIDKYLKIVTPDGVSYADHPTYGKEIDGVEASLRVLTSARNTAEKAANAKVSADLTKAALTLAYDPATSPSDLAAMEVRLAENAHLMSVSDYQTARDAIDESLDIKGFAGRSTPDLYTSYKARVTKGDMSSADLSNPTVKANLSLKDYRELQSLALKKEEALLDTSKRALAAGIKDTEKWLMKSVAQQDAFGGFLEDDGPAKGKMASQLWNQYVIEYAENNDGANPPLNEANAESTRIIQAVVKAFPGVDFGVGDKKDDKKEAKPAVELTPELQTTIDKIDVIKKDTTRTLQDAVLANEITLDEVKAYDQYFDSLKQGASEEPEGTGVWEALKNLFD